MIELHNISTKHRMDWLLGIHSGTITIYGAPDTPAITQWDGQLPENYEAVEKALIKTARKAVAPPDAGRLVNWAFHRFGSPSKGFVLAYTAQEAISLVHAVHGYVGDTSVHSPLLNETWLDRGLGVIIKK